ncbi:nucleoside diphosphate kinase [Candidatus Caldarchaeum subterraneum]|uniref:Nucleoside diphosphate kinase n=1 Tax=Caldiarchaeum subterraneum TaxID=311458 RepID=E6N584_CALS0|nr:nucleoside diphosphate kinase [Candidatus Caldarchaeum subterraneum]BAJ47476.1 nucleoside diphosphate kinase [Candidatus Caldarchaeum subterraneum]BAJ49277.1 nucleoside diphosphate kinase [Candidatus Caldarchaeum subterraneum]BAJ50292.1 nucleoside diphosphate kinase [Candidatus Caldarchaeum subterraneum]
MDRTFVILKPNAVSRGLVGEIISRFERKGLKPLAIQLKQLTRDEAARLYEVHRGKPFYEDLLTAITKGPVVLMVLEGRQAVEVVRKLIGATDPVKAEPGTIRGDYGLDITDNLVHASDSAEAYQRESAIFFTGLEKTH